MSKAPPLPPGTLFDRLPDTPAKLFWLRVSESPDLIALRDKKLGIWRSVTWRDYGDAVRKTAHAMAACGMERGAVSSVLSENRPEWLYCDIAAISLGAVGNGIYTTSAPPQVAYVLQDSRTRIVFVEDEEQLDKVLAVRDECPDLTHIVVFETDGLRDFDDPMVMNFASFLELGAKHLADNPGMVDDAVAAGTPDELAILIYTSGTTGRPKAAMISNDNLIFQVSTAPTLTPIGPGDQTLSFLPLCHIAERNYAVYMSMGFGNTVNFAENPETMLANLREVSPTAVFAPPRTWEKLYSMVTLAVKDATAFQRWIYRKAIDLGGKVAEIEDAGKTPSFGLKALNWVVGTMGLTNIRTFMGIGKARFALTGAAPISPDMIRWFRALGLRLREAYGLTESVGLATVMPFEVNEAGSVGVAPDGIEIALSDAGEILVRGRNVFMGYLNKPEQTAETIGADGWLHTGDVGVIGNNGFLKITDRLKDVIVTAGGKNITPSEIENQLKFSPYIADAVIIGDQRKFLSCLIMIDFDNVAKFAQDGHVPFTNYASLCAAEEVNSLIAGEVEQVNKTVARVEQIKKFQLIDIQLTAEDEELTPTMKLKRSFVSEKYKTLIDGMYA